MDIPEFLFEPIVRAALTEDIGAGDITTTVCIPAGTTASATVLAKSPGVVAGLAVGALAFRLLDPNARWEALAEDGAKVGAGRHAIARVSGDARALLTAERVALNFMQRMSGVATVTARYVDLVAGTKARIIDTRKTTPGLRVLEKYAVRVGGGVNHRLGLYDCVLIKDNHIKAAGGITAAVTAARAQAPHTMKVEVEASTIPQVREALACGADIILLDNMGLNLLRESVEIIGGRAITEASGGLNESTVAAVAATGVDVLSIGALTHSAPAMDISLDFAE
ncbi:nicotinate-nucleotide diphosphorylase (carboxylating) [Capsulimonas corticalis]|uniref:Probable nicotinate-nucleotide pyrophosphorylase [carboxylating] n=1 Tax=Capsulimonas corticalis TaxID=2219043 RepID=A0A402CY01_9BACT|nr:carboxylating nicotinate-nucleotide diphosphorylase [Capsulimonas corticalis]BDI32145.1 nicotinate-nucleotide diphosphorylase (carboxylating) [Capsulimonas corticalis]